MEIRFTLFPARSSLIAISAFLLLNGSFAEAEDANLPSLRQEIEALTNDLTCAKNSDCQVFEFGSKACGGPDSYHLYSIKTVNQKELLEKVALYNSADKNSDQQDGILSTCDIVSRPTVECSTGKCRQLTSRLYETIQ